MAGVKHFADKAALTELLAEFLSLHPGKYSKFMVINAAWLRGRKRGIEPILKIGNG